MAVLTLRTERITATLKLLSLRIGERFPDSGLLRVSTELVVMGESAAENARRISRPNYPVRIAVGVLIVVILGIVATLFSAALDDFDQLTKGSLIEVLTAVESGTNEIVLIGLAILFLVSVESRIKRSRALRFIHELRSLAHVIDMHQLTKDPGYYRGTTKATKSSPERTLSLQELMRYLEYCSELLSMTSKVAAVYAQEMNDRVVLAAVGDVEMLVTGLTQKIWQKLDIAGAIQTDT